MRLLLEFFLTAFLMLILDTSCFVGAQNCTSGANPVQIACEAVNLLNVITPFDKNKVKFLLWTSLNPGNESYVTLKPYSNVDLPNTTFDAGNPTYVLFHGFSDVGTKPWILETKTIILSLGNANVFSVDYGELVKKEATDVEYVPAVCNAYQVAKYSAEVFDWLHQQTGLSAALIYIIGHSLGAQVAGIMGFYMIGLSIGKVKRITGLDPAGPLFSKIFANSCRLDETQAYFVDIIHTNACNNTLECNGLKEPAGHADFFPNGGKIQPGCDVTNSSCSHQRATALWVESIKSFEFISWPCDSWKNYEGKNCTSCGSKGCEIMGFNLDTSANGTYYLTTNSASPYAKGNVQ